MVFFSETVYDFIMIINVGVALSLTSLTLCKSFLSIFCPIIIKNKMLTMSEPSLTHIYHTFPLRAFLSSIIFPSVASSSTPGPHRVSFMSCAKSSFSH